MNFFFLSLFLLSFFIFFLPGFTFHWSFDKCCFCFSHIIFLLLLPPCFWRFPQLLSWQIQPYRNLNHPFSLWQFPQVGNWIEYPPSLLELFRILWKDPAFF